MSSCTLLRIQSHFLRLSSECSSDSFRCQFPILVDTLLFLLPPSFFTHPLMRSVQCRCLSTDGVWVSVHASVRSLPGGQVNIPSFWKTPRALEVDQCLLLGSLKHFFFKKALLVIENSNNIKVNNCTMKSQVPSTQL